MSTQVESSTQTQQQIAAARARAAAKIELANAQSLEESAAQQATDDAAWRQNLAWLAQWLPAWMLEYVERQEFQQYGTHECVWDRVLLPGCCPLQIRHYGPRLDRIHVLRPLHVAYDMDHSEEFPWRVMTDFSWSIDDLDLAIDDAAQHGESWHEMSLEAARRNAAGQRPEPPAPGIPDPIDQARQLVNMLSNGDDVHHYRGKVDENIADADDRTLVLAAVGIAIAHHLSRVADALEQRNQYLAF